METEQESMELMEAQSMAMQEMTKEDNSIRPVLALPDYETIDRQKILSNVKDLFKGFSEPTAGSCMFESTEQLSEYTKRTVADIKNVYASAEACEIQYKAAIMARYWCLACSIDDALTRGNHGEYACQKLAAQLGWSVPYVYQVRAMAKKLTIEDCYLLGVRGLDLTHLKKLAQIKDDNIRTGIINAFIQQIKDTSDTDKMERAKKQFIAAVNTDQNQNTITIGTSDPLNGGSDTEVSEEYTAAKNALLSWKKMLKKPASDDALNTLVNALGDFYLTKDTPDAEQRLDDVRQEALAVANLMRSMQTSIEQALRELDSIQNAELL